MEKTSTPYTKRLASIQFTGIITQDIPQSQLIRIAEISKYISDLAIFMLPNLQSLEVVA
ncbi:hypothetical protein [Tolypothrix sp. VBCCA 56010]|uniref:hypothetical protein n=1 Tax=Tolypothrix sp. VBCCA 56010 TaxID=3137731 RepID=UPI003D7E324A